MRANKGFTLIELIIVIAIMAVLVGFLVPQYIKHVDKSRMVNDEQLITAIHNALGAAILDENIAERPLAGFTPPEIDLDDLGSITYYSAYPEFVDEFKGFVQTDDISSLRKRLKSKEYKDQHIYITINATNQQVKVRVPSGSGGDDFMVE